MSLQIYASARAQFAEGSWNWPLLRVRAYLMPATFVANLEVDRITSVLVPTAVATTTLTGLILDNKGYCRADPISFFNLVLPVPVNQIVLGNIDAGRVILHLGFPTLPANPTPRPFRVIFSDPTKLFRL